MSKKKIPKCEFCEKDATYWLNVCNDHLAAIDKNMSRRPQKK